MILTRRFGALAARRTFPRIDKTAQEQILNLPSAKVETETEHVSARTAA